MKQKQFSEITSDQFSEWLELGLQMWPHYRKKRHVLEAELKDYLNSPDAVVLGCFVDGKMVGFQYAALRSEYVAGAATRPVCYLEGAYVLPEYRRQGISSEFVRMVEEWARERGITELASDAELENAVSHQFHKKNGFREVKRTVSYIKRLS